VRWTRSVLLLVAAMAMFSDLQAQSAQAVSLQVSGLYNGLYGNVFQGLDNGAGVEAQIRYTPSALSFGAGFQYTGHGFNNPSFHENARLYGGFFEPRYRIHTGSYVVAPYVSARFAILKLGFSGGDLSVSSTLIQLNGGGGLLYRLAPRVNLDFGATYGYDRLGAGTFDSKQFGQLGPAFPARSGSNVVVRIGFAVGIGG
jgi:Outer membrane protein beta-barrel domain